MASLDASFVTETSSPMFMETSDLLQQLPELIVFPFLGTPHCLESAEALDTPQQPLEHASPFPVLRRLFSEVLEEPRESRRILRDDSVEWRSLPEVDRLSDGQQDSCPRAIKARQMQPKASSVAAYLARAERRCWSHGLPSGLWQAEPVGSTGQC